MGNSRLDAVPGLVCECVSHVKTGGTNRDGNPIWKGDSSLFVRHGSIDHHLIHMRNVHDEPVHRIDLVDAWDTGMPATSGGVLPRGRTGVLPSSETDPVATAGAVQDTDATGTGILDDRSDE